MKLFGHEASIGGKIHKKNFVRKTWWKESAWKTCK